MFVNRNKRIISLVLCAAFVTGTLFAGHYRAEAVEKENIVTGPSVSGSVVSGSTVTTVTTQDPIPGPSVPQVDTSKIALSKTKANLMAGKKLTLVITGTQSPVTWASRNPSAATVSAAGVVKGVKKGSAVIEASVDGITLSCTVRVVAKMSKKDFGKFKGENFISFCQRKGYNHGYAWWHQYKGNGKKKKTYRGIKIGKKKSTVDKAYGDLKWNKCKSKDPFTKIKGFKKNKVKKYGDVKYGKYRIRFYLNKSNKVVAIVLACNIGRIKKRDLKAYM